MDNKEKFEQIILSDNKDADYININACVNYMQSAYDLALKDSLLPYYPKEDFLKPLGHDNNIYPCPFCGGEEGDQVFLGRVNPDHYQIVCCYCGIKMKHDRKDKVIGIWNNYTTNRNIVLTSRITARIKELEESKVGRHNIKQLIEVRIDELQNLLKDKGE